MLSRGLLIAAAGACLALGAGHGVASADSDSTDGGAASSSAPSSDSSHASTNGPTVASKDVDKGQDSAADPKGADRPTSTVSASTVTIDHDEPITSKTVTSKTVTSKPAEQDESVPAEDSEPSKNATTAEASTVEPAVAVTPEEPAEVATVDEVALVATPPVAKVSSGVVNRSLAAPVVDAVAHAPSPGPLTTVVISLLSAFGLLPPGPPAPTHVVGVAAQPVPGTSSVDGVTGVKVGSSNLAITVGSSTYTGAADWYFPTQADGTVQAQGVTLLQHGFLGSKSWYSALAQQLAQQTNSIVVVPNVPSFAFFTCRGCTLSDVAMQQGVATLFIDPNRTALNASAAAAGFQGVLPEKFTLTGHSAGGGLAAAAGGFYTDAVAPADNDLLGVVMYDGVSSNGTFAPALASLGASGIPVYQIAAPPQAWNANGQTTADLVALRPGQFVGAVLANGSHVDSLIGGAPIIDFISQLVIKPSPRGNTAAVYTLAAGWINDLYAGRGPADARYGSYGVPGQTIVLGPTSAVVLGSPAPAQELSTRNTALSLDGRAQTGQSVGQQCIHGLRRI